MSILSCETTQKEKNVFMGIEFEKVLGGRKTK